MQAVDALVSLHRQASNNMRVAVEHTTSMGRGEPPLRLTVGSDWLLFVLIDSLDCLTAGMTWRAAAVLQISKHSWTTSHPESIKSFAVYIWTFFCACSVTQETVDSHLLCYLPGTGFCVTSAAGAPGPAWSPHPPFDQCFGFLLNKSCQTFQPGGHFLLKAAF